jgi:hypothetical protein
MEQVSEILQCLIVQALKRLPAEELPAAAWHFAAGKAVADKTCVLDCNLCDEKRTLVVEVPDATWRAQLYAMTPQFLAGLNQFTRIDRIEFKLAGSQDARNSKSTTPH